LKGIYFRRIGKATATALNAEEKRKNAKYAKGAVARRAGVLRTPTHADGGAVDMDGAPAKLGKLREGCRGSSGFVGRKVPAVVAGLAASGFFDSGLRKEREGLRSE
jgi:hypothetical protein